MTDTGRERYLVLLNYLLALAALLPWLVLPEIVTNRYSVHYGFLRDVWQCVDWLWPSADLFQLQQSLAGVLLPVTALLLPALLSVCFSCWGQRSCQDDLHRTHFSWMFRTGRAALGFVLVLALFPWLLFLGIEGPFEAARASGSDNWLVLMGLWLFFGSLMLVSPLLYLAFIIHAIQLGLGLLRWFQRRPVVPRFRWYWRSC
ncbi:MAG: hypothetical protein Q4B17_08315 [Lautropia sp.]|nr:hypothetical protein [Lautropia sp.]